MPTYKDEVEELRDALSNRDTLAPYINVFDLTKVQARFLHALMQREMVARESLYSVLYFDKDDDKRPEPKILDVILSHVRKKLKPHNIKIDTVQGVGFSLTLPNRYKVRDALEATPVQTESADGSTTFVIEDDIPIPVHGRSVSKYPFEQMKIGQSFFAPGATVARMQGAAQGFRNKHKDYRFAVRAEGKGARVWRIPLK